MDKTYFRDVRFQATDDVEVNMTEVDRIYAFPVKVGQVTVTCYVPIAAKLDSTCSYLEAAD